MFIHLFYLDMDINEERRILRMLDSIEKEERAVNEELVQEE